LQELGEKGHGWFMATLEGVAVAYLAVRMCSFAGRIQAQAALAVYNLLYQSIGVYTAWPTSTRTNSPGEATLQELINLQAYIFLLRRFLPGVEVSRGS
jgi:hypothetical protein